MCDFFAGHYLADREGTSEIRGGKRNLSPVIGLQILYGQQVDVSPRSVEQPPGERVPWGGVVLPCNLHRVRLPDNVAGHYERVRTSGLVVFGGCTERHLLGFLAVHADHAHDEHPDLPAVRHALVCLRDVYRQLVMGLCNFDVLIVPVPRSFNLFTRANGLREESDFTCARFQF